MLTGTSYILAMLFSNEVSECVDMGMCVRLWVCVRDVHKLHTHTPYMR